jgi:hypothetical protein
MKKMFYRFHVRITPLNIRTHLFALLALSLLVLPASAQYVNVPVSGFNADVVADGVGAPSVSAPHGVDAGNYVFIDSTYDYNGTCPRTTVGVMPGNNRISSITTPGLTYELQSYNGLNVLRLPLASSGKLTFNTPARAANLYLLVVAGGGAITSGVNVTVKFTDSSSQVFTGLSVVDWCSGTNPATPVFMRIQNTATACGTGATCQYLYDLTLPLLSANYGKSVAYLDITKTTATNYLSIFAVGMLPPCTGVPAAQPTSLSATTLTTGSISGSFTPSSPAAPGYLIVRYPQGAPVITLPVNGTQYMAGQSLGAGTVVQSSASTSFTANGLNGGTSYDFYVYAYEGACMPLSSAHAYLTTAPLTGTLSTNSCGSSISGTIPVGAGLPNTPTGGYSSLTAALSDISIGGLAGNTILELQSSYDGTSATETFPITFPLNPCIIQTHSLTIRPAAGISTPLAINSNAAITLNMNGAAYITIDGRPGGTGTTSMLSIINTNSAGAAIQFINDAHHNTVTYCDIQGQNASSTSAALSGVIYFATATVNGNDFNTISYCDIHATAGGFPAIGISAYGSTTNAAAWNDLNTITHCNIYDFFSATLASCAIKCDVGNNAYTISNNKIYQTASRTYTTANQHRAFWLTTGSTGGAGFQVIGNFIGGDNASGTGMYTMTGSVGTNFWAMDINHAGTAHTSVQGNTITQLSLTSTTTTANDLFRGICTGNSGHVDIGNITGNIIGSDTANNKIILSSTGSGAISYGIRNGSTASSTDTILISNNIIGGISASSTTATSAANLYGIAVASGSGSYTTITGNTIGSTTLANSLNAPNPATSVQSVYGISVQGGIVTTITGNTIMNLNNGYISNSTTALTRGISVLTTTTNTVITGNTIANITTASTATGSVATAALAGIVMNTSNPATVSANHIHSLTNVSTSTTAASHVEGIVLGATGALPTHEVNRNFIHNLGATAANNAVVLTGIDILGGAFILTNNMVSLGIMPDGTPITTEMQMRGIFLNTTTPANIYHNSVYIGGTGVGSATRNTMAFQRNVTSGAHDVKNNIFVNNRSNATTGGKHYQVYVNSANNFTPGYNQYAGNGTGAVFASINNATSDIAAYAAAWVPSDLNSASGDPHFILPDGGAATVNLHISTAVATPVEGTGTALTTTIADFDGDNRSSNTPVDMGADAGMFIGAPMTADSTIVTQNTAKALVDAVNQQIVSIRVHTTNNYNALVIDSFMLNTAGTTNINDISDAKVFYTGASPVFATTNQYGSTIAAPNGAFTVAGNLALSNGVNYFWVTYNVKNTATPGNALDVRVDDIRIAGGVNPLILDGNPAGARLISGPLSGSYTIGSGGDYPTITAAATDLSVLGVNGAVTLTLLDALYPSETFPITFGNIRGSSATNTITLMPASSGTVITGASTIAIFDLNGSNYFTIDGRPGGSGPDITVPNSSYLTISNTDNAGVTIRMINDARFNTIRYCDLQGQNNVNSNLGGTPAGVVFIGTTTGTNGNDNNRIDNCNIHSTLSGTVMTMGVYSYGPVNASWVGAYNDSNTVSNCNIYDYYGGAALSASGIVLDKGTNAWNITGNSFFQTSSRTPVLTASVNNRAIWITPTNGGGVGNSFMITGNYIGGTEPHCGGVNYTFNATGPSNALFQAIHLSVLGGTASSIKANTITKLDLSQGASTNDLFHAMWIPNSGNVNIGGPLAADGNIIGSSTSTGAIILNSAGSGITPSHMILVNGGSTNATTIQISHNSIGGIDLTGNGNGFTGIFITSSATVQVSNNLIGSLGVPNSINANNTGTNVQFVRGIAIPSGSPTVTVTNNIIANLNNNGTSTTTGTATANANITHTAGIYMMSSTALVPAVSGNVIRNLTCAAPHTSTGGNASVIGIASTAAAVASTISGNTIDSLVNTSGSITAASMVHGIYFAGSNSLTNTVSGNLINNLSYASVNPNAFVRGIEAGSTSRVNVYNNMLRLGIRYDGTDLTTALTITGILKSSGGNCNFYHNTVYIGGGNVGTDTKNTAAFQRSGAGTDDVRNNIFVNNRSNASTGGKHYQVLLNNATTITVNNNLYYGTGTGSVFGSANNGTTDIVPYTMLWIPSDINSASADPQLLAPAAASSLMSLHINNTVPTPAESAGAPIALVTDDYDGQPRSTHTPTDIGADADNFTAQDIFSPVFGTFTAGNTSSTGTRTINVTLTDYTGVPLTGGLAPRAYYYKVSSGVATGTVSSAATRISGTPQNGLWSFTINDADMGGLMVDDSVYFYLVAQDSSATNNTSSMPAGALATDVNSVLTPPAVWRSYRIVPGYSGNYNVGASEFYTSLTRAGGIFEALNNGALSGNITLTITSDLNEDGTHGLNQWAESGAGNYTLTIMPDGTTERLIAGNVSTGGSGLIRLNGADRVTIDGRFAGSGRYLRFLNRAQAGTTFIFQNDAQNNTLTYAIVEGINNTTGTILFGNSAVLNGTGNDFNQVTNCLIRDTLGTTTGNTPNTGISSSGTAGAENSDNLIMNNEIYNFGYNGINLNGTGTGNNWAIISNKFYLTSSRTNNMEIILIQGGGGHSIISNSIGGAAPDRSGAMFVSSGSVTGIAFRNTVNTAFPTTVAATNFANIGSTGTFNATRGVDMAGGTITITGNTFGGSILPSDSVLNGGEGAAIYVSGGTGTITGNMIGELKYTAAQASYRHSGIHLSGGTHVVAGNTIRNIEGNNTTTGATLIVAGISVSGGTNHTIESNTISNIRNTNTGTSAYPVAGINITGSTASVNRNRISNVSAAGTGTGTSAPLVYGMYLSVGGITVANNQVSTGFATAGESRVFGVQDVSSSGTNAYYHNSIFVNGNTASGSNHSYGMNRTSTGVFNAVNNLVYNKRTSSGSGLAFAVASTNAVTNANFNYNLLVVNDTASLAQVGGTTAGWRAFNSLYVAGPNTNWAERASQIPAHLLLTDTATGDLGIVTSSAYSWYVNGKGIRIPGISGDYNAASGVRSTSIANGPVDIGSVEFTTGTTPPAAYTDQAPALNGSTSFYVASRLVARADWGSAGTVPSATELHYYSGVAPANTLGGTTFMNAYWDLSATGGSGYSYTLTLMNDSAILGTTGAIADLDIARYNAAATDWVRYAATTVNPVTGLMTAAGMNTGGIFTGTDGANNPLPVKLLTLAASANAGDVTVTWSTASEMNSKGFEVQSSADGRSFKNAGFVKGAGNSNTVLAYSLKDAGAFARNNSQVLFYRLKQLDNDGTFAYSETVKVSQQDKAQQKLAAYPNPFSEAYIVSFDAPAAGTTTLTMVDLQGRSVAEHTVTATKGINTVTIDKLGGLHAGIYFVKVTTNGHTEVMKLIKE